jgi:uncharacterized membrane protein (TIGR02234 family)
MTDQGAAGVRGLRIAQVLLLVAAALLWGAGRLTWVVLTTADGLGQPKTQELSGSTWSAALVPVALLLAAAAVATLAVRGWPLRLVAVLLAVVSAATGYLAVAQWVVPDVSVRAAQLVEVPYFEVVGHQRQYGGAALALAAAVATLVTAVLLLRSATAGRASASRYTTPGARRSAAAEAPEVSERTMWDALDEGQDPTEHDPDDRPDPPAEGR